MFKFNEWRSSEIKIQVPLSVCAFYLLTIHQTCLNLGKLGKFLVRTLKNCSPTGLLGIYMMYFTFLYHFKMKHFFRMIE